MTAADTAASRVLSDVELLTKKNKEVSSLKVQRALLIIFVLMLSSVIALVALVSRFSSPAAEPAIDVTQRQVFDTDGSTIRVPATYEPGQERPIITAGKSFTYNTRGKKLESVGGEVGYQLNCRVQDVEQLTQIGTAYSDTPKGDFDITRSFTIPVSTRLENSDECRLQTIVHYTFYQADQAGNTRPIDVKEIGISNYFKLIVQDTETSVVPATNQSPVGSTGVPQDQPIALVEPSRPTQPVTDPPDTTTLPEYPAKPSGLIPAVKDVVRNIKETLLGIEQ